MLRQVVNRLNQWLPTQKPPSDWRRDPLVEQLPPSLRDLPPLEDAAAMEFSSYDGFMLEEAVWLRDLSNWARGNTLDDLQRARKLFDWTVRNIQLDPESVDRTPLLPREVLLLGHGTALERAWVFILLARQQRLDAAVLALDKGAATRKPAAAKEDPGGVPAAVPLVDLQPWCVAVLVEGKQLYLFDPRLGLPIPAQGPIAVDHNGQLDIHPATLAQAAADNGLLRRLDLNADLPYPVKAADLKHARAAGRRLAAVPGQADEAVGIASGGQAGDGPDGQPGGPGAAAGTGGRSTGHGAALGTPLRGPGASPAAAPAGHHPQLLILLPFYALSRRRRPCTAAGCCTSRDSSTASRGRPPVTRLPGPRTRKSKRALQAEAARHRKYAAARTTTGQRATRPVACQGPRVPRSASNEPAIGSA